MPEDYPQPGMEAPINIGGELRELEVLVNKFGAVLTPLLRPRLERVTPTEPATTLPPSYMKRLASIRHELNDLLGALEV